MTVNELNGVFSPIAREIDVHIKAAQANGDAQHERYLSGRLRRLIAIKDGRIKELNKAEEKA